MNKEKLIWFLKLPINKKLVLCRNKYFNLLRLKSESKSTKKLPAYKKNNSNIYFDEPKVSIMLPIYNHADVANQAIKSIINQTYKNIELIILDDGSTDNLQNLLKKYKNNPKIIFYKQKNQKLPRSLTHLHKLASGNFLTWTSADNVMHKGMIKMLVDELLKNPEASLVYSDVTVIGANSRPYYKPCRDVNRDRKKPKIIRLLQNDLPLSLDCDNYINASFLYRKNASDCLLGTYYDDIIGAEDYDFWLRLQKSGNLQHINTNKPYYYYRVHDNSMSHELETKKIQMHQARLAKLLNYEKKRKDWTNIRPYLNISKMFPQDKIDDLTATIRNLPFDSNLLNSSSYNIEKQINILSCDEKCDEGVYIELCNDMYILKNKNIEKPVSSFFYGQNISPLAYKARNYMSRNYYVDELFNCKQFVLGSFIDGNDINLEFLRAFLAINKNIKLVLLDKNFSKEINNISKDTKYNNLIYYSNKMLGEDFNIYSNLSRLIIMPVNNNKNYYTNIFNNLLLGYAIGRKICYFSSIDSNGFLSTFPYTIKYNTEKILIGKDYFSKADYDIMDKYIYEYSKVGALNRIIKLYNTHTQDIYVQRPKYEVDLIPPESSPYPIDFSK